MRIGRWEYATDSAAYLNISERLIVMKIDWKRKLTSRKLWVSLAGLISGLIVIFGGSQAEADKISGAILSGAAVVGYVLGEGLADSANIITPDQGGNKEEKP